MWRPHAPPHDMKEVRAEAICWPDADRACRCADIRASRTTTPGRSSARGRPRNRAKCTPSSPRCTSNGNLGVALRNGAPPLRPMATMPRRTACTAWCTCRRRKHPARGELRARAAPAPNDADINHTTDGSSARRREPVSVKYFLQAIRNPLYPRRGALFGRRRLHDEDEPAQDAERFRARAQFEPDEPASLVSLGQIRYRQGNIGEARKLVTRYNKLVTPTPSPVARGAHRAPDGRARAGAGVRQPAAPPLPGVEGIPGAPARPV